MKGQDNPFGSLLLFTFLAIAVTVSTYIIVGSYLKGSGMVIAKTQNIQEKSIIPQFQVSDVVYQEFGTVAIVNFTIFNLGNEPIPLNQWTIDFVDPNNLNKFCSMIIFQSSSDAATIGVAEDVFLPKENKTISFGEVIPPHSYAFVTLTLLSGCLNETINWSRSNLEMGMKITIHPTSYTNMMACNVNPYTGYASCSSINYIASQ
ncbi:MAG: hypothetical protein ACP5G1_01485 [Nanopusillaceae archaeon]